MRRGEARPFIRRWPFVGAGERPCSRPGRAGCECPPRSVRRRRRSRPEQDPQRARSRARSPSAAARRPNPQPRLHPGRVGALRGVLVRRRRAPPGAGPSHASASDHGMGSRGVQAASGGPGRRSRAERTPDRTGRRAAVGGIRRRRPQRSCSVVAAAEGVGVALTRWCDANLRAERGPRSSAVPVTAVSRAGSRPGSRGRSR